MVGRTKQVQFVVVVDVDPDASLIQLADVARCLEDAADHMPTSVFDG